MKLYWNDHDCNLVDKINNNYTTLLHYFDKLLSEIKTTQYNLKPLDEKLKDGLKYDIKTFLTWFYENCEELFVFLRMNVCEQITDYISFDDFLKFSLLAYIKDVYRTKLPISFSEYKKLIIDISEIDNVFYKNKSVFLKIYDNSNISKLNETLKKYELFKQFDVCLN